MTPDLKLANAYVMPLGGERADEIVAALNRHQRFIRGRIAPELDLKFAPEVRFFVDTTFAEFAASTRCSNPTACRRTCTRTRARRSSAFGASTASEEAASRAPGSSRTRSGASPSAGRRSSTCPG
ncbi:MAG: ribosome-binding factor A [Hyphomicrobium sp.]